MAEIEKVRALVYLFVQRHSPYHRIPQCSIECLNAQPLKSFRMEDAVSEWDAKFVDVTQEMLFDIILAANYMDITSLLDLTCAKVACMMKGKTPEEIRQTFNIVNDFTPEEEAQVLEENKWCEEA